MTMLAVVYNHDQTHTVEHVARIVGAVVVISLFVLLVAYIVWSAHR